MSKPGDYEAVRKDLAASMKKPNYDDGSLGPVFVRLAWYVAFRHLLAESTSVGLATVPE